MQGVLVDCLWTIQGTHFSEAIRRTFEDILDGHNGWVLPES